MKKLTTNDGHIITQDELNYHVLIHKDGKLVWSKNATRSLSLAELYEIYEFYKRTMGE